MLVCCVLLKAAEKTVVKDRFQRRGKSLPPFLRVERELFNSPVWAALSHSAIRVYLCFRNAENGHNKNDLRVSYAFIQRHGVKGTATISSAIKELDAAGLIDIVDHGGIYKRSSVYGISERWKNQRATSKNEVVSFGKRSKEHCKELTIASKNEAVGLKS